MVAQLTKILTLLLLLSAPLAHAELYKWVDENGKIYFSDQKPAENKTEVETVTLQITTYTYVSVDDYDAGDTDSDSANKKVVMYSTAWCGYCKKARKHFKKNNIAYIDYDIEKNKSAKKRYDKLGGTGVPVILVGKKRMNGFSASGFDKIYNN